MAASGFEQAPFHPPTPRPAPAATPSQPTKTGILNGLAEPHTRTAVRRMLLISKETFPTRTDAVATARHVLRVRVRAPCKVKRRRSLTPPYAAGRGIVQQGRESRRCNLHGIKAVEGVRQYRERARVTLFAVRTINRDGQDSQDKDLDFRSEISNLKSQIPGWHAHCRKDCALK